MFDLVKHICSACWSSSRARRRFRHPLEGIAGIERLEDRSLLSADFGFAAVFGSSGHDFGQDVAADPAGNVYATGFFNGTVDFDPGPGTFNLSSAGSADIYVSKLDSAGNFVWAKRFGSTGFDVGGGIAVDGAGNVYVTGRFSDNAFKITPAGVVTEIIDATGDGGGNGLNAPYGIAVDGAGNVYVAGDGSSNAFKITPAGGITQIIDCTGDGTADCNVVGDHRLLNPGGIAVDVAGNVYVAGGNSHNAFRITPGGLITKIIDATGDGAGNVFFFPQGIAVDAVGNA